MKRTLLQDLTNYLNTRTLPGGPFQIGPGISWSVILPRQNFAEDLKATLSDPRVRTFVGVVMPNGSRKLESSRDGYGPLQPRGGAIREMTVNLTIFTRSLKAYAYGGEILEIEDFLEEVIGDFSTKDSETALAASLGGLTLAVIPPDFTVLEFEATIRYRTKSSKDRPIGVITGLEPAPGPGGGGSGSGGAGGGSGGSSGGVVIVPGDVLVQNPDGSFVIPPALDPDNSHGGGLTVNPDGSVTDANGNTYFPGPDGVIDLGDGILVIVRPDGTIQLVERRPGLLHYVLQFQPTVDDDE